MNIQIDRADPIKADRIEIEMPDQETCFRIQINKQGELIINKIHYGIGSSSITITPNVSNEIYLK